jgi:hypothetical protein
MYISPVSFDSKTTSMSVSSPLIIDSLDRFPLPDIAPRAAGSTNLQKPFHDACCFQDSIVFSRRVFRGYFWFAFEVDDFHRLDSLAVRVVE